MEAPQLAAMVLSAHTLRTTRESLPDALALMAHVLREASFPATELEQLRSQVLTGLEARRTDLSALVGERLARNANVFEPDDPRYVPSTAELIERVRAVRREDLVALHRELLGASYGELAIVGDFDPDAIAPVLERELGTWRSPHAYTRIDSIYRDVKPIDDTIVVPDKASATLAAQLLLRTRDDDPAHPEYPALVLANYALGGLMRFIHEPHRNPHIIDDRILHRQFNFLPFARALTLEECGDHPAGRMNSGSGVADRRRWLERQ